VRGKGGRKGEGRAYSNDIAQKITNKLRSFIICRGEDVVLISIAVIGQHDVRFILRALQNEVFIFIIPKTALGREKTARGGGGRQGR
jgi:hypothetical protein